VKVKPGTVHQREEVERKWIGMYEKGYTAARLISSGF
jgi:hypothetical protein